MDSLIFELQIIFHFQLFLSANVRHNVLKLTIGSIRVANSFKADETKTPPQTFETIKPPLRHPNR